MGTEDIVTEDIEELVTEITEDTVTEDTKDTVTEDVWVLEPGGDTEYTVTEYTDTVTEDVWVVEPGGDTEGGSDSPSTGRGAAAGGCTDWGHTGGGVGHDWLDMSQAST